jgi:hypothetical protein
VDSSGRRSTLICLSALFGILQNDATPMRIDNTPLFDFLQGSKATEAGQVVV